MLQPQIDRGELVLRLLETARAGETDVVLESEHCSRQISLCLQGQRAAVQRSAQRGPPRARHKRSVGFKHHAAVIRLQAARRMTRAEAVEQTAPEGQSSQLELAGIVQVRPIERYVFCRRCAVGIFSCSTQGRRVIAVRASKDDHPRDDLFLRTAKGIGRADSGGGAPQA